MAAPTERPSPRPNGPPLHGGAGAPGGSGLGGWGGGSGGGSGSRASDVTPGAARGRSRSRSGLHGASRDVAQHHATPGCGLGCAPGAAGQRRRPGLHLRGRVVSVAASAGIAAAFVVWRAGALGRVGAAAAVAAAGVRGWWTRRLWCRGGLIGGTGAAAAAGLGERGGPTGSRSGGGGDGHVVLRVPLPPLCGAAALAGGVQPGGGRPAPATRAVTTAAQTVATATAVASVGAAAGLETAAAAAAAVERTNQAGHEQSEPPDAAAEEALEQAVGQAVGREQGDNDNNEVEAEALEVHVLYLQALSEAAADSALRALLADPLLCALGLDAEWEPETQPGSRHRISVLQLATRSSCWVLHLGGGGGGGGTATTPSGSGGGGASGGPPARLPRLVQQLLANPRVAKAGVGVREDVRRLQRDFGVTVRGAVDVRLVAQRVAPAHLAAGSSLRALTASLLGRALDKAPQRSHWGAGHLDERQITYAAHDAWLSLELLHALYDTHRRHSTALQLQPYAAATAGGGAAAAAAATAAASQAAGLREFVTPFLDVLCVNGNSNGNSNGNGGAVARPNLVASASAAAAPQPSAAAQGAAGASTAAAAAARVAKDHKLSTRKSALYENCRLLAPDGVVLCTCGAKKIQWYVDRGLAVLECEAPLTARLTFEPRGRGHADDRYYLADKENCCCACGAGSGSGSGGPADYLRHSVVPHCYRRLFPHDMKSHLSHDIVLMCPHCHLKCSLADQQRMVALGAQYGAPLGAASSAKMRYDPQLGAVRSAGRALTARNRDAIPPHRRAQLEDVVRSHFGLGEGEPLEEATLARAAAIEQFSEDASWCGHAEIVVRALGGDDAVEAFVRSWRRHFLDVMQPRFLPPHWSVDARVANSASKPPASSGLRKQQHEQPPPPP